MKNLLDIAISETGFVFDPSTGHTFRLNGTGMSIMKMFQNGYEIHMIAEKIAEEFDIDKEGALEDIEEFVSLLKSMGFLIIDAP